MQMQKASVQRLEESRDIADRKRNDHMHYSSAETFFHNPIFCHKIHSGGDYGRTTFQLNQFQHYFQIQQTISNPFIFLGPAFRFRQLLV